MLMWMIKMVMAMEIKTIVWWVWEDVFCCQAKLWMGNAMTRNISMYGCCSRLAAYCIGKTLMWGMQYNTSGVRVSYFKCKALPQLLYEWSVGTFLVLQQLRLKGNQTGSDQWHVTNNGDHAVSVCSSMSMDTSTCYDLIVIGGGLIGSACVRWNW